MCLGGLRYLKYSGSKERVIEQLIYLLFAPQEQHRSNAWCLVLMFGTGNTYLTFGRARIKYHLVSTAPDGDE